MAKKLKPELVDLAENDQVWEQFLEIARKEIPTEGSLEAIYEKGEADGILHKRKLNQAWKSLVAKLEGPLEPERNAWYYLDFLRKAEKKTTSGLAAELGVAPTHLSRLKADRRPVTEFSFISFCSEFCSINTEYDRHKLFKLLRRALSIYAMVGQSEPLLKAARKKPKK